MEYDREGDTNCNWCIWNNSQRFGVRTGRSGNQRTCRDFPVYSIIKIGLNTEESPGEEYSY